MWIAREWQNFRIAAEVAETPRTVASVGNCSGFDISRASIIFAADGEVDVEFRRG
jgi:hypothetical protein